MKQNTYEKNSFEENPVKTVMLFFLSKTAPLCVTEEALNNSHGRRLSG